MSPRFSYMLKIMAVSAAVIGIGVTGVVPVWSQALQIEAMYVVEAVPLDDPWDEIWTRVPMEEVPLSAQNIVAPFGGGTVNGLRVRALHDDARLYLLLEWPDEEVNEGVAGTTDFSDAAAVQFPVIAEAATPYTMGGPGTPVNIWQWKAVWQRDLAEGFSGTLSEYPDTYVDLYPNEGETLFRPAEEVGNPLAQRLHASPIENLVAEGFGTLTSSETQDVEGAGVWLQGSWRALFARDLAPETEGLAAFSVDGSTMAAFAVWDGQAGDRDGQKSIAQFVDLSLSSRELSVAPAPVEGGIGSLLIVVVVVAIVAALAVRLATLGRPGSAIRVEETPPEEE